MSSTLNATVIGGGPAGLMAAEVLSAGGIQVELYDAMPSLGRKFLLAGVGGMNITHAEATADFLSRYGERQAQLQPLLEQFDASALRSWITELGIDTFVGSSGRVFPTAMKAAPLLRAWLRRLRGQGVHFHTRHRWLGWDEQGALHFSRPGGEISVNSQCTVLALGGGSWARLGSDGAWLPLLARRGVDVAELQAANCGFETRWSSHFSERFAGQPLKAIAVTIEDTEGRLYRDCGELMVTEQGVEGSLIYRWSATLRGRLQRDGAVAVSLDLNPDHSEAQLREQLEKPRGKASLANHLRKRAGIHGIKAGILRELAEPQAFTDMALLAANLKQLPLTLHATRPLDEAISSAGGVRFEALTEQLMLRDIPGVFCAGEMLDWEAPTGGYLLTACFASGRQAGQGALKYVRNRRGGNHPTELL